MRVRWTARYAGEKLGMPESALARGQPRGQPHSQPHGQRPRSVAADLTRGWLGDIVLRACYGWGGLNGLAMLAALCIALTLRLLYTRMTSEGVNWILAAFWALLWTFGHLVTSVSL